MICLGDVIAIAQCVMAASLAVGNGQIGVKETADGETLYQVRLTEQSYAEILNRYADATGLEITGRFPAGTETFDCGDEWMTFEAIIIERLCMVLRNSSEMMWLSVPRGREHGCVVSFAETGRLLGPDRIFLSVNRFAKADADPNSIVLVQMESSSDIDSYIHRLQNWAPGHISIVRKAKEDALLFFGIGRDVRHYLEFAKLLDEAANDQSVRMFRPAHGDIDALVADLQADGFDLHEASLDPAQPDRESPLPHQPGYYESRLGMTAPRADVWFDRAFSRLAIRTEQRRMASVIDIASPPPNP